MQSHISLLDLPDLRVYQFEKKVPTALKGQSWRMIECKHGSAIIQGQSSQIQVYLRKQIVMIRYEDSKAYFSKLENGYISLHFPINNENIDVFQYKLQQNDFALFEWNQAKDAIIKDIIKQCGTKIAKQKCIEVSGVQKVSTTVGKLFGSLNKMVKGKPEKVGEAVNSKVEELKDKHMDEEKKSKWTSIKGKLTSMNKNIGESLKPVGKKYNQVTTQVGEKFETSDNTVVKGIRDFGHKVKTSLNKGFSSSAEEGKQGPKVEVQMDSKEKKPENQPEQKQEVKLSEVKPQEVKHEEVKQEEIKNEVREEEILDYPNIDSERVLS